MFTSSFSGQVESGKNRSQAASMVGVTNRSVAMLNSAFMRPWYHFSGSAPHVPEIMLVDCTHTMRTLYGSPVTMASSVQSGCPCRMLSQKNG